MTPTNPFAVAVELHRETLKTSRQTLESGISFQHALGEALVNSIETQGEAQRRVLGMQYTTLRRMLTEVDDGTPGRMVDDEVLTTMDEQAAALYTEQQETVESLRTEVETSVETVGSLTTDSVTALDDQLAVIAAALEELEAHAETALREFDES